MVTFAFFLVVLIGMFALSFWLMLKEDLKMIPTICLMLCSLFGLLFLGYDGDPIRNIPPNGDYKVVFVYASGPDVHFGLKSQASDETERVIYYRLPKDIFDGNFLPPNPTSVRLIVGEVGNNETGKFKRLHFEPLAAESGGLTEPNK